MPDPFEGKDKLQHQVSDTDLNWSSPHHTLGKGPTQAAPGRHRHTYDEIDESPLIPGEPDLTPFVHKDGDTMTGSLKLDVPRHYGVMFIEPGGEERVIGIRTTTSGVAGVGVFKPGTDATNPLALTPFGVGEPTQAEHAITKEYLESTNAGLKTNLQIAGGWAELGSTYAGAWATAYGPLVTIEAVLKVTVNYAMAAGGSYQMAAVGTGFRPAHDVIADCLYAPAGATTYRTARLTISAGGPIYLVPATAETLLTASGWVSFLVTYRRG